MRRAAVAELTRLAECGHSSSSQERNAASTAPLRVKNGGSSSRCGTYQERIRHDHDLRADSGGPLWPSAESGALHRLGAVLGYPTSLQTRYFSRCHGRRCDQNTSVALITFGLDHHSRSSSLGGRMPKMQKICLRSKKTGSRAQVMPFSMRAVGMQTSRLSTDMLKRSTFRVSSTFRP